MVKVKKDKLRPGMVVAEDIVGKNNIVLKSGTVLSERFIALLNNETLFSVNYIPVTDESYNAVLIKLPEELKKDIAITHKKISNRLIEKLQIEEIDEESYKTNTDMIDISEEINIPGNLVVNGDIINCSSIYVAGTLSVFGDIKNSNITAKGNILIHGDIENDNKYFKINSFGTVTVNNIKNATINAESINVRYSIKKSEIIADKNIEGPSAMYIQESKLQAGYNILLGSVKQKTTLIIFSEKQSQLVKKLFEIGKRLRDFDKEIEPLKQSIKVFQILRNRVNELPPEKRAKLISNMRLAQAKLAKRRFLHHQFVTLKVEAEKIKSTREKGPIIIENEVEKGTKVIIDNSSFVVHMKDKGVVFYKKGMIIMGKKDKEWGKI